MGQRFATRFVTRVTSSIDVCTICHRREGDKSCSHCTCFVSLIFNTWMVNFTFLCASNFSKYSKSDFTYYCKRLGFLRRLNGKFFRSINISLFPTAWALLSSNVSHFLFFGREDILSIMFVLYCSIVFLMCTVRVTSEKWFTCVYCTGDRRRGM